MITNIEKTKALEANGYIKPESNFVDKKNMKRLFKNSKEPDYWA